jgi:hypothetical protein
MHKRLTDRVRFKLWLLRDSVRNYLLGTKHREQVFSRIYTENLWGDAESCSGRGSSNAATEAVRRELPALFDRYQVRSLLDAPCGDFVWMQTLIGSLDRYIGIDIVPEIISTNAAAFGSEKVSFLRADITVPPLPAADMILCRDCFIHLPTRMILAALRNFKATGARYLLLTNERDSGEYHDIAVGSFRPIDFTRPPFSFPEPVHRLNESPEGGRQLCLWELQALSV